MLAHTSAELSKDPSATTVARRMIRRFRIVVPPGTKLVFPEKLPRKLTFARPLFC
jgi:hypothetical protein